MMTWANENLIMNFEADRVSDPNYSNQLQQLLSSMTYELAGLYEKDPDDEMSTHLNQYLGLLRRCRRELPAAEDCSYEVGRMEGVLDAFRLLYEHRMEQTRTDAEIEKQLSGSRRATMCILQALYERRGEEELTHDQLAKVVGTSKQSLTNIMKRLEPTLIIRTQLTGARKYYSLTDAGIRYCEKVKRQEEGYMAELSAMFAKLQAQIQDADDYKSRNAELKAEVKSLKEQLEAAQEEKTGNRMVIKQFIISGDQVRAAMEEPDASFLSAIAAKEYDRRRGGEKFSSRRSVLKKSTAVAGQKKFMTDNNENDLWPYENDVKSQLLLAGVKR